MTNQQIARYIQTFQKVRSELIENLVSRPSNNETAQNIISCNNKIELLQSMWNWSDETVDFPL